MSCEHARIGALVLAGERVEHETRAGDKWCSEPLQAQIQTTKLAYSVSLRDSYHA